MSTEALRSQLARARLLLAVLACLLGLIACTIGGRVGSGGVLQQDWDARRGPVVPHDTFPRDCSLCHEGGSWSSIRADFVFDHEKETGTPLRGAHARAECLRCHNDRGPVQQFSQQGCVGCHDDEHRGKQGSNCSLCHTETNWSVNDAIALHARTRFPLFGVHAATECWRCHEGAQVGNFDRAPVDCANCHQADLATATNPDHAAMGWTQDCGHCHAPASWGAGEFNHSWYPLVGQHRVPPRACTDCHQNNVWAGTPNLCVDCHMAAFQNTTSPQHSAANFPTTCQDCHTPNGWQPSSWQHTSAFPLRSGHALSASVTCASCHAGGVYTGTSSDCVSCHLADYNGTTQPDHAAAGYPTSCSNCHDTTDFHHAVFNHDSWPLTGTHLQVNCTDCHLNNNYSNAPTLCYGCHQSDYDGSTAPAHLAGAFPTTCQDCHTTVHFTPSSFHHTSTFPLTQGHAQPPRACTDCHTGSYPYPGTPNTCAGCHGPSAAINPVYDLGNYSAMHGQMGGRPHVCTECHNTSVWAPATFSHAAGQTGWDYFTGLHLPPHQTSCTPCHAGTNYSNAPTNCYGCHQADYNGTTNPPHAASTYPTTCQLCHTTDGWQGATFNHGWWPLEGAHAVPPRACVDCHPSGYGKTPNTCIGCHANTAPGTPGAPTYPDNPPNHTKFPTTCETCHSTVNWFGATFDHSVFWPLTGLHTVPPRVCVDCHTSGTYGPMPTTCVSCHLADYQGTTSPPHASSGFPQTCETCHTTAGWTGATFNHSWWPLTGLHSVPPRVCADCHVNGNFNNMPTTCAGCHGTGATIDPVYSTTDAPPHAATPNLFSQSCQTCHTTAGWSPATFPHTGVSFTLSGAHVSPPLACNACHTGTGAGWRITQYACDNCHHADWQGTTNPNHSQLGIPTTCANCHSTNPNWTPVTMNHTGITGACSSCHMADYNATTNPDHQIQGYPLTCSSSGPFTCHTSTTSWTPNGFNPSTTHDGTLPLPHHNSRCNQCHTTPQVFTAFSCISGGCHGQSSTNSEHQGVSGYQYNSNACYNCHPHGQSLQGDQPARTSKTPIATRTPKLRPRRKPPVGVPGPGTPAPSPPATHSPTAGHP